MLRKLGSQIYILAIINFYFYSRVRQLNPYKNIFSKITTFIVTNKALRNILFKKKKSILITSLKTQTNFPSSQRLYQRISFP